MSAQISRYVVALSQPMSSFDKPLTATLQIRGEVYDVTEFVDSHPGGAAMMLKYAGRDATAAYEPIHASGTINKYLSEAQRLGAVADEADESYEDSIATRRESPVHAPLTRPRDDQVIGTRPRKRPRLSSMISIADFAHAAEVLLPTTSYAFLGTGAEDNHSITRNHTTWQTVRLRPRVLRPIPSAPNTRRRILGNDFSAPFFVCPAGGAKLCHPEGDTLLTQAADQQGLLHWVCKREGDLKARIAEEGVDGDAAEEDDDGEGFKKQPKIARPPVYVDFTFDSAVAWLRGLTTLPIVIKGIQTWEDALLCHQYGVHPWLSNHGGRQLDSAPSALETLLDIREFCPAVLQECEVFVDGGITRGSDIVKAIALGARAVGIGRGFLYPMVFGQRGVEKAMEILKHEIETTLALIGVMSLDELGPQHVDTRRAFHSLARL
ncbi:Cytochrome b2, mitochondrial [Cyphellophora attinorum]|uniref:Cytochrome b2, mitochondrial n=1 Tax=Cyphellophora attinorum TaxID=1664694 RepID=A0A0N1HUH4_9EURO|nr:Cytochrome b2, mitochondrial [Phialophora attinorum]KPI43043.1 Cytochrome b2, mitochondrial [Phialophora attinorum]